jgi:hypothetical protein
MPITEQSGFSKVDIQYKKVKMSTEVIKTAQQGANIAPFTWASPWSRME